MNTPMGLEKVVTLIAARPGMYVPDQTARGLADFLQGYLYALGEMYGIDNPDREKYAAFHAWTAERYNMEGNYSWEQVLRLHYPDGSVALAKFFDDKNTSRVQGLVREVEDFIFAMSVIVAPESEKELFRMCCVFTRFEGRSLQLMT